MKVYDNNLDRIENIELETYFDDLVNKQILFVEGMGNIQKKLLDTRKENIQVVKTSETYKNIIDGKVMDRKFPSSARAFATKMILNHNENDIDIINGVYFQNLNDVVNFVHELYHSLSARNKLPLDENGNFYDKVGLLIKEYDKDENQIDISLNANGLNEGVTELLTTKFLNRNQPSAYDFQVYVSDILTGLDKSLFKAYFSDNKEEFISFLDSFSRRQNYVTKEQLISMPSSQNLPFNSMLLMLKASIEYDISFAKNKEELITEYQRLKQIVESMKANFNVCETEEEYNSINEILENLISNKLLQFEEKDNFESKQNINKVMGYSKVSLLIALNIIVSVGIIFLGLFFIG